MGDWQNGLFGCFSNCGVCIITYILPCVTAGRNAEAVGEGCFLYGCLSILGPIGIWSRAKIRGKIREQKGIEVSWFTMSLIFFPRAVNALVYGTPFYPFLEILRWRCSLSLCQFTVDCCSYDTEADTFYVVRIDHSVSSHEWQAFWHLDFSKKYFPHPRLVLRLFTVRKKSIWLRSGIYTVK